MTTTFNISVQDGDFGWSNNFTDASEAVRCTAASLYHGESPSVIRCDDGDITVLAPMDIPASVSLEEALAELDAYYQELSFTDEAAINDWDRDRVRARRLPRRAYLLRGILRCPVCNRAYGGGASGQHRYYRDGGKQHRALRADAAEEAVWGAVQRILGDDGNLMQGWQETREGTSQERKATQAQLDLAEQQHEKALTKMDRLTASYVDPDIPMGKQEYTRLRADIQREADRAIEKAEKLRQRLTADGITEAHMRSREEFVAQIRDQLLDADFNAKREVLGALQVTGDVTWTEEGRAEITLSGLFPPIEVGLSSSTSERLWARRARCPLCPP